MLSVDRTTRILSSFRDGGHCNGVSMDDNGLESFCFFMDMQHWFEYHTGLMVVSVRKLLLRMLSWRAAATHAGTTKKRAAITNPHSGSCVVQVFLPCGWGLGRNPGQTALHSAKNKDEHGSTVAMLIA